MSVPEPQPLQSDQAGEVVAFIAAQQAKADRSISYVGTEAAGIAAELDGLEPSWTTTARILRDGSALAGVVIAEWDLELGRSWINGPWVDGDDPVWTEAANVLLDAALALLPAEVTRHEMSGDIANRRLTALATARGWTTTSEANHVLVADAAVVTGWPTAADTDAGSLRPATTDDVDAIKVLHDVEFPDTYASAAQLVEGQLDGSRVVLVAEDEAGRVVGYAAGEVHDDGEGFVDFLVVDPSVHRSGVGRRLVTTLTRQLLDRSSLGRVALTVQDRRTPARALYRHLGFRPDGILVGHRSWTT
jgi:ribosomal protein S18 acetylase RimI-like enzyme